MKLSQAQLCFLAIAHEAPYRTPFTGNRLAGRTASAWYRTAASLEKRGLVMIQRAGDAQKAYITDSGRRAYARASFDNRHED